MNVRQGSLIMDSEVYHKDQKTNHKNAKPNRRIAMNLRNPLELTFLLRIPKRINFSKFIT